MNASWRTSVTGILTIVIAVSSAALIYFKTGAMPDFTVLITSVTAGIGLIAARDNKVSSEAAGAK